MNVNGKNLHEKENRTGTLWYSHVQGKIPDS
jgi:hypothetical protein